VAYLETHISIEYQFENTVVKNIVLLGTTFALVEQKLQCWKLWNHVMFLHYKIHLER
jgi:hypothetical protein